MNDLHLVGMEGEYRRVWPQPDLEPVEFNLPRCCYSSWITEDLIKELEE